MLLEKDGLRKPAPFGRSKKNGCGNRKGRVEKTRAFLEAEKGGLRKHVPPGNLKRTERANLCFFFFFFFESEKDKVSENPRFLW